MNLCFNSVQSIFQLPVTLKGNNVYKSNMTWPRAPVSVAPVSSIKILIDYAPMIGHGNGTSQPAHIDIVKIFHNLQIKIISILKTPDLCTEEIEIIKIIVKRITSFRESQLNELSVDNLGI